MDANDTNAQRGQESSGTDTETIAARGDLAADVTDAREAAGPLAAYVAGYWRREGVTPGDADGWDPMEAGGHYVTDSVPGRNVLVTGASGEDVETDDATAEVTYTPESLRLHLSAPTAGATLELTPEQAADLAARLYAAAWEWVNFPRAGGVPSAGGHADGTCSSARTVDDYTDLGTLEPAETGGGD